MKSIRPARPLTLVNQETAMRPWVVTTTWCATLGLHGWFTFLLFALPSATAADPAEQSPAVLFREHFDDPHLLQRGWYDGSRFAIAATQPYAGAGCIEYSWKAGTTTPASSSGLRRLFAPTETVYLRFHLKLSQGWGWTGRPYHPHLMHFLTTANEKFAGPAATHLTVYV
jgi:hypothetical protein